MNEVKLSDDLVAVLDDEFSLLNYNNILIMTKEDSIKVLAFLASHNNKYFVFYDDIVTSEFEDVFFTEEDARNYVANKDLPSAYYIEVYYTDGTRQVLYNEV